MLLKFVNIVKANKEVYILNWLILYYVNFISIFKSKAWCFMPVFPVG